MCKSIYYAELDSSSTIKIFKYSSSRWNLFKSVAHGISRENFGWAFHDERLYTLGGYMSQDGGCYSKNVSLLSFIIINHARKTYFHLKSLHIKGPYA